MARFPGPIGYGDGSDVDIADFVFTNDGEGSSTISLTDKDMTLETSRTEPGIDADINLNAADDIFINANGDDVRIFASDEVMITSNDAEFSFNSSGRFVLPSLGYIENIANASGDGNNYDIIKIVPDASLEGNDQCLIIDPTAPNHIHIRAGGTQDDSNATLILGAERTNVSLTDSNGSIGVTTKIPDDVVSYENVHTASANFMIIDAEVYMDYVIVDGTTYQLNVGSNTSVVDAGQTTVTIPGATFVPGQSYVFGDVLGENYWYFGNDGYLLGPGMGTLLITSLGNFTAYPLSISADESIVLSGTNGEFLNDAEFAENQIATIGDIQNTVSDVISYSPVWSATGLAFTGTPATGSYIKIGSLVQVQIDVDFTNVTNFGSGQYSITLPFASRYHTDVYGGSVHDVGVSTDHSSLKGHLSANSNAMTIWSIGSSSQDEPFDHNSPIVLTTSDKFHMAFSYIAE